ncbi:hypothetical protein ILUMI_11183 [Ignelater luminosus]|uniref:Endonuclease/exonuclease/phosphatase domain-containing protein n=1 Tax=Ignelater luminosus TaxID=2038154 RepID=A0A8K0GDG9_IGNLU|nr:hypothetical protein ILUMI_11183 [Ignelater luminosus]
MIEGFDVRPAPLLLEKVQNAKNPSRGNQLNGCNRRQLCKRKRTMNISTWNVKNLSTKQNKLLNEIKRFDMDIVAVTETKKKGKGSEHMHDYIHLYSDVDKASKAMAGISIFIKKQLARNIKDWNPINERLIKVDLKLRGYEVVVIGIYAPCNDELNTVKDDHQFHLAFRHNCTFVNDDDKDDNTHLINNVRFNLNSLQNESTIFLYRLRLSAKLSNLPYTDGRTMYYNIIKCLEEAAEEALGEKPHKESTFIAKKLFTLHFADNQVIIAENKGDIYYMLRKLDDEYHKWGLAINTDKTEYIVAGYMARDLVLNQGLIKGVKSYKYLGVTITNEGTNKTEI